jgi:hypothetical protein
MEVQVKKAKFSPATSLLMAFSLVMGILVSDSASISLFTTTAHAQTSFCTGQATGTAAGRALKFAEGIALGGITLRNVLIGDQVVSQATVSGSVQLGDSTVVSLDGVIVGDPNSINGVIVGDPHAVIGVGGSTSTDGVIVGDPNSVSVNGVIVGDPNAVAGPSANTSTDGVIVGDPNSVSVNGVIVGDPNTVVVNGGSTATGGLLTGDNLTIQNGVITGQNLRLVGSTITGCSVTSGGGVRGIRVNPAR